MQVVEGVRMGPGGKPDICKYCRENQLSGVCIKFVAV